MALRDKLPVASWMWRTVTGRCTRLLGISLLGVFILLTICARISIYFAARRMQAVVAGLSKLEIDKTTEEELVRVVPYLVRSPWDGQVKRTPETGDIDLGTRRSYYAKFSNDETLMKYSELINTLRLCPTASRLTKDGYQEGCLFLVPDLLGYRYFTFGASVTLLNGKVSSIRYGIYDRLVFPSPLGAIVSVRSFHSIWRAHQIGFAVDSLQDESPTFQVSAGEYHLDLAYAYDASPELTKHAFQIDLSCFWSLRGCHNAQQIAPQLWKDGAAIESAAVARLSSSEPCPDRILAGRIRYLPDAGVTLAKSKGFRHVEESIEGEKQFNTVTDFDSVELLRPPRVGSIVGVRGRPYTPFSGDYRKQSLIRSFQWADAGKQVFFFSNMNFASCQIVPATPEAISRVRSLAGAPRREEDQTGMSLQ